MDTENNSKKRDILLLTIPLWFPVVYSVAFWLELKFTHHGPLNELAIYVLFASPAIGGLPLLMSSKQPLIVKLFVFPVYYFASILVSGIIGWILCDAMHTCH